MITIGDELLRQNSCFGYCYRSVRGLSLPIFASTDGFFNQFNISLQARISVTT
jgi:hypothetical protein